MLPLLCSGCASSVGSKAARSRSSIAGRRAAASAMPRSRPSSFELMVDIIVTAGIAGVAAKQATSSIPIVLGVAIDPVGDGLVMSLARPGGNVTGLSLQGPDVAGKRLELLRERSEDFEKGHDWRDVVNRALAGAKCFILLWTEPNV